jgi:hypothetical protein
VAVLGCKVSGLRFGMLHSLPPRHHMALRLSPSVRHQAPAGLGLRFRGFGISGPSFKAYG